MSIYLDQMIYGYIIEHKKPYPAGRVEAKIAIRNRQPALTSHHFIQQYFQSFAEDPISKLLAKHFESDSDDSPLNQDNATG